MKKTNTKITKNAKTACVTESYTINLGSMGQKFFAVGDTFKIVDMPNPFMYKVLWQRHFFRKNEYVLLRAANCRVY